MTSIPKSVDSFSSRPYGCVISTAGLRGSCPGRQTINDAKTSKE